MNNFNFVSSELRTLIAEWEPKFINLDSELIQNKRNTQNRTIKQIVGHMIDSASNNTHRIVHLQYQESPFFFPNYATYGNNDRWIAIQNYQDENWDHLVQLWTYSNLHVAHIIEHVDSTKLANKWIADKDKTITLEAMIIDYLRHFKLHLEEIKKLNQHET